VAEHKQARGQEVLVFDQDEAVLSGLERWLAEAGLSVTALSDMHRACDQIEQRFIPVVLCDLDSPTQDAGLGLLAFVRDKAPLSAVVVMTQRTGFEAAAAAFRLGAFDVVPKSSDHVAYLRDRVVEAATKVHNTVSRDQLLRDVGKIHEDFLTQMMALSRKVMDLEDKLRVFQHPTQTISTVGSTGPTKVLLVGNEPALASVLTGEILKQSSADWSLRWVQSGSEALDAVAQAPPHVAVIKTELPDLPVNMVVSTFRSASPDTVILLFSPPSSAGAGEVKMMESSGLIPVIPSLSDPRQLVAILKEVRDGIIQKTDQRRYLRAFRHQHMEFLKKYNLIKERL
jgi:DNA-binding NtrC family response regulator